LRTLGVSAPELANARRIRAGISERLPHIRAEICERSAYPRWISERLRRIHPNFKLMHYSGQHVNLVFILKILSKTHSL